MALSYGATFISLLLLLVLAVWPLLLYGHSMVMLPQYVCGVIIAFIFFGLRTRRMGAKLNVSTFPQLLGRHYHSRGIQVL